MKERRGAQLCNSSAALVYRKACATSSPSSTQALQAWGWGAVGFPSGPSGQMRRPGLLSLLQIRVRILLHLHSPRLLAFSPTPCAKRIRWKIPPPQTPLPSSGGGFREKDA